VKLKFRTPNTVVLLLGVLTVFAVLTWIIPGGSYDRVVQNGREVVDPGSFQSVPSDPATPLDLLMAPIRGFTDSYTIAIALFVFMVAGAFNIIQQTGTVERIVRRSALFFRDNPRYRAGFVPFFMVMFSMFGMSFGMSEEVLVFIPLFVALTLALGYDSITGVAIPFVGAGLGFAGAVYNPFTVGIAQGLAEVPIYSGSGFRFIMFASITILGIWMVARYANRVWQSPDLSPVRAIDLERAASGHAAFTDGETRMHWNHIVILSLFFAALGLLVYGVTQLDWYFQELTALFLLLALLSAIIGRLSSDEAVAAFLGGMKDVLGAVVVIALSRSILLLISDANIIDTILYTLSSGLANVHPIASGQLMLLVQTAINVIVPSGSGQAALTIPVMAPLGDLIGITRQTVVVIFQLGDGLTNMIIPTSGITMGVLGMAKIPWEVWAKWLFPRLVGLYILAFLLVGIAVVAGLE